MKLAVISDVHADVHALQDALVQIERLGCDAIVCAGDTVDYGFYAEANVMRSTPRGSGR
jgi:predicted phosphodiesterase